MTRPVALLGKARHHSQDLLKKISATTARAEAAAWTEGKGVQADTLALAA